MTSKRSLKNDIEQLDEEALEGLPPGYRLKLFLKAQADGKESMADKVFEMTPRREGPETAYRRLATTLFALRAAFNLTTKRLKYIWYQSTPPEAFAEGVRPSDAEDLSQEQQAMLRNHMAAPVYYGLYIQYHAYSRFAEEVIGVDLRTWFEGVCIDMWFDLDLIADDVVSDVEHTLAVDDGRLEDMNDVLPLSADLIEDVADEAEIEEEISSPASIDDLVDTYYESFRDEWKMFTEGERVEGVV